MLLEIYISRHVHMFVRFSNAKLIYFVQVDRGGEEFDEFNRKGGEYAMVEL